MARVTKVNIQEFQEKLLEWFKSNNRNFDWRTAGLNEYELIIAEVLLQRTKAETVARFYQKFITDYSDWDSLANADLKEIEEYLMPIGLYRQRAIRLKNLAVNMSSRKGELPTNREELESIPFFGQYIANAIELLIFNRPMPLIDVNMSRVLERYFGERKMADIRYDPYLQKLANKVVNIAETKELNWAILDFAAAICKAQKPLCEICILNKKCSFFNKKNY